MTLNKILIGLLLLLMVSTVSATSMADTRLSISTLSFRTVSLNDIACESATYQGKPLSQVSFELPKDIATVLNGENINLEVTGATPRDKKTVSGKVNNNVLSELSCSPRADASLTAYVTTDVIAKIANSSNPIQAYKDAKASGEISFKPIGFVTGIKLFIADLFLMFQQ